MRSFRILSLVAVAILLSSNLFARICQPKQPITCGVVTISTPAPALHAVKAHRPAPTQQAMACGPWVVTFPYCAQTTLTGAMKASPKPHTPVKTQKQAMCCGPWVVTFPYCSAHTLG